MLAAQAWAREAYDRPVIGISIGNTAHPRAWSDPPDPRPPSRPCPVGKVAPSGPVHRRAGAARLDIVEAGGLSLIAMSTRHEASELSGEGR